MKTKLLIGALASACAFPALADSKNVDIYGVAAFYGMFVDNGTDRTNSLENESRIGFRGSKDLKNGPKLIWQIESGFVGNKGVDEGWRGGMLGLRDTFAGFEGDFGKVRFGRLITGFYETVDFPLANPSKFVVWDWWGSGIYGQPHRDRQSHQLRWDTPKVGGFNGSLSVGRSGGDAAGNVGKNDGYFVSGIGHYAIGPVSVHAGYERTNGQQVACNGDYRDDCGGNNPAIEKAKYDATLLGGVADLGGGLSVHAGWKMLKGSYDLATPDMRQNQYVAGATYVTGDWQFKVAHARNDNVKAGQTLEGTAKHLTTARALYFLDPSAVAFLTIQRAGNGKNASTFGSANGASGTRVLLGGEYYF